MWTTVNTFVLYTWNWKKIDLDILSEEQWNMWGDEYAECENHFTKFMNIEPSYTP